MYLYFRYKLFLFIFIVTGHALSGCDSRTVDPLQESPEIYAIYSALEVGSTNNLIRVRKTDTVLLADSSEFNGTVTFTALDTGIENVLTDSVINYNGHFTHNFKIDLPVEFDSKYMVRVESDEGEYSEAIASTPQETVLTLKPDPADAEISCHTRIEFRFSNVTEAEFIRMMIGFNYDGKMYWERLALLGPFERDVEANELFVLLTPHWMLIEVFTPPIPENNPFIDPRTLRPLVGCLDLVDTTVYIEFFHFGDEWIEALPLEIGNLDIQSGLIKNGIGFFGGYHFDSFTIPLTLD